MGIQNQTETEAVFKIIHHLHMVGAESDFIGGQPDVIFHIAGTHGKGNFVIIKLFFHGTDRALARAVKNVVDWDFV